MQHSPYERTLFLDTDTWVARDIDGLFELLDHYDLAASQLSEGHQYTIPEVPHSFPEFNTGVILFSRRLVEKGFFDTWKQHHLAWKKTGPERGLAPFDIASDQLSFRLAVYQSPEIRTHVLPPEYNFMAVFPSYAVMDLFVIHCRPLEKIPRILEADNPRFHHRIYLPSQGLFVGERMDRKSIRTLCFHLAFLWCKELLRPYPRIYLFLKKAKGLWK
jgi:hypothetical protein